jgi:hypothetical protein
MPVVERQSCADQASSFEFIGHEMKMDRASDTHALPSSASDISLITRALPAILLFSCIQELLSTGNNFSNVHTM